MLAEPRRRVRYGLNPNGCQYSENPSEDKGKKMLSQMGWSEGSGLGAQGQGITAPIKASVKNNLNGIGFSSATGEQLLDARMIPFNNLLGQLKQCQAENSGVSTNSSSESEVSDEETLPVKQTTAYSRVKHHRRIHVKDLSKRTAEEMRCIIGTSAVSQTPGSEAKVVEKVLEVEKAESPAVESSQGSTEDTESSFVTRVSSVNMMDYFRSKMAARMKASSQNLETMEEESPSSSKSKDSENASDEAMDNHCTETSINNDENTVKQKKKKKSKSRDVLEEEPVLQHPEETDSHTATKKKKKHKDHKIDNDDLPSVIESSEKKKCKRKSKVAFEDIAVNEESDQTNELVQKKKRRKEKREKEEVSLAKGAPVQTTEQDYIAPKSQCNENSLSCNPEYIDSAEIFSHQHMLSITGYRFF